MKDSSNKDSVTRKVTRKNSMDYLEASHRFDEDRFSKKLRSFDKWFGHESSCQVFSEALRLCKDDLDDVTDSEDEIDAPKKIQKHDGALEQMFRSRPDRVVEESDPGEAELPKRMPMPILLQVKLPLPSTKQTYNAEKKAKKAENTESTTANTSLESSQNTHDTARKVKKMDEALPKQRKIRSSKSSSDDLSKSEHGAVRRPRIRREELDSNGARPQTKSLNNSSDDLSKSEHGVVRRPRIRREELLSNGARPRTKSLNNRRRERLSQSDHRGSRRQNYEPSSIGATAERRGSVAVRSGRRISVERRGSVVPTSSEQKTERRSSGSSAARARRRGLVVASSSEPKAEPWGAGVARSEPRDSITRSERPPTSSSTALATSKRRGSTARSERRDLKTRSRSTDSQNRRSSGVERSNSDPSSSTDKSRRKSLTQRPCSRKNPVRSKSNDDEPSIVADEQGDFSVNLPKAGRPTLPRGDSGRSLGSFEYRRSTGEDPNGRREMKKRMLKGSRISLMQANSGENISALHGSSSSLGSTESRRKDSNSGEDPICRREMMKRMDSVGSFFDKGRGEVRASQTTISMIPKKAT
jgi:hypothetical protein